MHTMTPLHESDSFSAPVLGPRARALVLVLLVGGAALFLSLAPLAAHESWLACSAPAACLHVERYPFGYERQQALPHIVSAETEWSPGGRSKALRLVLSHADGSFTEYQGVGANGENAPRVARALNSFLQQSQGSMKFGLREGSLVVGVFLVLVALTLLAATTQAFAKLRLHTAEGSLVLTRERWPLPQRVQKFGLSEVKGFSARRISVLGSVAYRVFLETQRTEVDVGLGSSIPGALDARVGELNEWFRKQTFSE